MKDFDGLLQRGGLPLLQYLEFCVLSRKLEPLFAFLVRDFRFAPSALKAIALYDAFCAPGAPAWLTSAGAVLPPANGSLAQELLKLRQKQEQHEQGSDPAEEFFVPAPLPAAFLFDFIIAFWKRQSPDPLAEALHGFDFEKSPLENLPGGRPNNAQQFFVANIWLARVRPQLVFAGFRRIVTIG